MFMFSGPYFLHIYAGHLPHLALMPWVPLLFLSIDGCFDDARNPKWWLLGAFVFAMILLAGHPQYVYYTGMAAAVYMVLNLIRPPTAANARPPLRGFAIAALFPSKCGREPSTMFVNGDGADVCRIETGGGFTRVAALSRAPPRPDASGAVAGAAGASAIPSPAPPRSRD